ncbi:LysR family transcriptional regulator [Bacillus wiedmannii]|uniref:LysR substrate-binding domain-containing protein n=1 Tax=Bacillus wiedmannii TaxID=1890302 RepID=UPI0010BF32DF|nr:LysR substrate-binding domain-containing protein [Bacillus wiedmannii]TKH98876.1 LysR family transcriptional regulator [Bacillus wiedmannii]
MTLTKYEIFNKVAELNSFTKAAEVLGFTQSAVSHAISSLEKEFSFPLFIRNHSTLTLTKNADELLITVRKILYYNNMLKQEVAAINGFQKGTVRVGVFSSISKNWIPGILKKMEEKFPNIEIELLEGNYAEVENWLQNGRLDCGFINNDTYFESFKKSFEIVQLKRDRLLCVVSNQSPLCKENQLSMQQVENVPFIMPTYQCYDDIQKIFRENKVSPNIRFENMNEYSVISMVENNLGISILPEMIIPTSKISFAAIPLESDSYRTIGLAIRKPTSLATKKFSEITKRWVSFESI